MGHFLGAIPSCSQILWEVEELQPNGMIFVAVVDAMALDSQWNQVETETLSGRFAKPCRFQLCPNPNCIRTNNNMDIYIYIWIYDICMTCKILQGLQMNLGAQTLSRRIKKHTYIYTYYIYILLLYIYIYTHITNLQRKDGKRGDVQ